MRLDSRRLDRNVRLAAQLLERRLPAVYPQNLPERLAEARGIELNAALVNARDGALELLRDAVEAERDARAAQERAVEALRHAGAASPSWLQIGAELGIGAQGAHKRFRHVEAPPAQTTIDEHLEGPAE